MYIVFSLSGSSEPADIESKIIEIYIPTLVIQLLILGGVLLGLKKSGGSLSEIGLGKADITLSNFLSGLIFFAGAFTLMIIIKSSITRSGYLPEKDFTYILPSTPMEKTFWVFLSAGAALFEEICFRGFIISRLRKIFGNYWFGAVAGSLAFSLGHIYQGPSGIALTFLYGMLFSGLYVARKSVFPCIVAHFLQDAIVLFVVFNT